MTINTKDEYLIVLQDLIDYHENLLNLKSDNEGAEEFRETMISIYNSDTPHNLKTELMFFKIVQEIEKGV